MREPQPAPRLRFRVFGLAMAVFDNVRELMRLISAFKEIKSVGTRRAVVMLIEELAQKAQQASKTPQSGN